MHKNKQHEQQYIKNDWKQLCANTSHLNAQYTDTAICAGEFPPIYSRHFRYFDMCTRRTHLIAVV